MAATEKYLMSDLHLDLDRPELPDTEQSGNGTRPETSLERQRHLT